LGWLLIVATLPAGVVGLLLEDAVEQAFSSPLFAGVALLLTGILMITAEIVNKKIGDIHDITIGSALWMGLMQALAIFPGISRSGSTISGGMFRHIRRESTARFSFLMSIPIMLAAGAISTYQLATEISNPKGFLPIMALGFVTAAVVGYIAIRWLLKFLSDHSLIYFSIYCFLLGGITIITWIF
jgi:undecaprenyl-diphosphatase